LTYEQKLEDLISLLDTFPPGHRRSKPVVLGYQYDENNQLMIYLAQLKDIIDNIPRIKAELKKLPLGASRGINGRIVHRGLLREGTQYYHLNHTIMHYTGGKVLHTENAEDLGRPEDFPDAILNLTMQAFDAVYAAIFIKDGVHKTTIEERKTNMRGYYKELISPFSAGCFENILSTWLQVVTMGNAIDWSVDRNLTFNENFGNIMKSTMDYLCREGMNINRRGKVYGEARPDYIDERMTPDEKKMYATNYVLRMLNNIDVPEEAHRHDRIIDLLDINHVLNKPVSDGTMDEVRIREYLTYADNDESAVNERCKDIWA
jgi:hypothetical protein